MMQDHEGDGMSVDDSSMGNDDSTLVRFEESRQYQEDLDEHEDEAWTWQDLAAGVEIRELNGWNVRVLTRQKLARLIVSSNGSDVDSNKISRQVERLVDWSFKLSRECDTNGLSCLHYAVTIGASFGVIKVLADSVPSSLTRGYRGSRYFQDGSRYFQDCPEKAAMYLSNDPDMTRYLIERAVTYVCSQLKYSWREAEQFFTGHCGREDVMTCFLKKVPVEFLRHWTKFGVFDERKELPLHFAVKNGAPLAVVKLLVQSYPALLQRGNEGRTPLHEALIRSDGVVDRDLIELLASPEVVRMEDGSGKIPLHLLCGYRYRTAELDLNVVRLLVDLDPETLLIPLKNGCIPLHSACSLYAKPESLPAIRYMIEKCPGSVMTLNGNGETSLHMALKYRHGESVVDILPTVQLLTGTYPEGASVARMKDGFIPLHVACAGSGNGTFQRVHFLAEAFPGSVTRTDRAGRTPLHQLCYHNGYRNSNQLQTIEYIANKNPELLRWRDNAGHTPLHLACIGQAGDEIIRFLVNKCPEALTISDETGVNTPLHLACDMPYPVLSILELLSVSETAVKARNGNGQTPLHLLSARGNSRDCLMVLLNAYPGLVCERDNVGRIALHVAIDGWRKESERLALLDEDADDDSYESYNSLSDYGDEGSDVEPEGPVESRYDETVQCLLEIYPEGIAVVDNDGVSPLMAAAMSDLSLDLIFRLVSVNPIVSLGLDG